MRYYVFAVLSLLLVEHTSHARRIPEVPAEGSKQTRPYRANFDYAPEGTESEAFNEIIHPGNNTLNFDGFSTLHRLSMTGDWHAIKTVLTIFRSDEPNAFERTYNEYAGLLQGKALAAIEAVELGTDSSQATQAEHYIRLCHCLGGVYHQHKHLPAPTKTLKMLEWVFKRKTWLGDRAIRGEITHNLANAFFGRITQSDDNPKLQRMDFARCLNLALMMQDTDDTDAYSALLQCLFLATKKIPGSGVHDYNVYRFGVFLMQNKDKPWADVARRNYIRV